MSDPRTDGLRTRSDQRQSRQAGAADRGSKYETVVISDSDVRVQSDYLRTVVARLADPKVGAVTCFYAPVPSEEKTFVQRVQSVGMLSDFYAGS